MPEAGDLIEAHFGPRTLIGRLLTNQACGPCIEVPGNGRFTRVHDLTGRTFHHVHVARCTCNRRPG